MSNNAVEEFGVLYTPDEENAIPASSGNNPQSPERLCEYDEGAQSGCRRTQTILALEAEYDTFVHPEMFWGFWDQFCQHEGFIYYHKHHIERLVNADNGSLSTDLSNTALTPQIDYVCQYLGFNLHTAPTLDKVFAFFRNPAKGFPALQLETPQFFQCEDVGTELITTANITREKLTLIQETFTDDVNPLLANLNGSLHLKDGKVFCTDYLAFENNPTAKLGVLMVAKETTGIYKTGNAYFFCFKPLTPEEEEFITNVGLIEIENKGTVVIVNL